MKKTVKFLVIIPVVILIIWGFNYKKNKLKVQSSQSNIEKTKIHWMTFEEALAKNKHEPRKFFIDVYTDWCGWCKVMDKKTFSHDLIASYVNSVYYPVKLDAEQRGEIVYDGQTYKFIETSRGKGYHELAATLLNGQLSYPTVVFFSPQDQLIAPVPGYQKPEDLHKILVYFGENNYKTIKWEDFVTSSYSSPF